MRCLLAFVLLCLAGPLAAAPLDITDVRGRVVTVDAPAQRVVVVFNFEELTAIGGAGVWDRVVGYNHTPWEKFRHSIWRRYADAIPRIRALPDVGHPEDDSFSVEKTASLRPDLVIMPQWGYATHAGAVDQLAAMGIPTIVIDYNAQVLEKHVASTLAIGKAMGAEDRARELAELYKREYDEVQRRVAAARATRPRVYVEVGMEGPDVIGPTFTTTMWGRILDLLGAENIAKGRIPGAQGQLNPELVLAADPDFLLLAGSSWQNQPRSVRLGYEVDEASARASIVPYLDRPGWRGLKAVKEGRVFAIQHGLARTLFDFVAMQYIAKALYPEAFADIDPYENLRAYHARWLPIEFGGVWMVKASE